MSRCLNFIAPVQPCVYNFSLQKKMIPSVAAAAALTSMAEKKKMNSRIEPVDTKKKFLNLGPVTRSSTTEAAKILHRRPGRPNKPGPFICPKCDFTSQYNNSRDNHMKAVHNIYNPRLEQQEKNTFRPHPMAPEPERKKPKIILDKPIGQLKSLVCKPAKDISVISFVLALSTGRPFSL